MLFKFHNKGLKTCALSVLDEEEKSYKEKEMLRQLEERMNNRSANPTAPENGNAKETEISLDVGSGQNLGNGTPLKEGPSFIYKFARKFALHG